MQALLADTSQIRQDLEYMTRRWGELDVPAVFEVRCFKEGTPQPKTFKYAPDWIDDAVEAIEEMNALGYNCYVVRNPIRADITGSARDEDIIAAFFLWADCDDGDAADNVKRFDGPKCSASIVTGRQPSVRAHIYWELAEPCTDLAKWREMQVSISRHFGSDGSVINPSRIMRIAGTVAYPAKHKVERGYQKELSRHKTYDRAAVTMDQMQRAFGASQPASTPQKTLENFDQFETLDRALAEASIKSDKDWRENVKKLVASYVARGWSDSEILGRCRDFTLQGYTQAETDADVAAFIKWTREAEAKNGGAYATDPGATRVEQSQTEATPLEVPFKFWTQKDLTQIPVPEFVYSDFYARGYTSVTLAPPKVGKSMLGLAEAIDIATGRGILTGTPRTPQKVIYYNAEDTQDVIDGRVAALLAHYGIQQSEIEGMLSATSGVDHPDFFLIGGQDGDIHEAVFKGMEAFCAEFRPAAMIFDPLQDMSRSPETNEVFRFLGQRLRRFASQANVAIGLIHHTRKMQPGSTPTIDDMRGGSALRGTSRFNRLLVPMSEDEGAKSGVENFRHFFRIGEMESNLAPPSAEINRWFEKVSVETPNGEYIGAIKGWDWPDAFDGITNQQAAQVRYAIDSMSEPPRADVRSSRWVGEVVAQTLSLDLSRPADKSKVKGLLSGWIKTDVLRFAEAKDSRAGRTVQVVICGSNDPLISGGDA